MNRIFRQTTNPWFNKKIEVLRRLTIKQLEFLRELWLYLYLFLLISHRSLRSQVGVEFPRHMVVGIHQRSQRRSKNWLRMEMRTIQNLGILDDLSRNKEIRVVIRTRPTWKFPWTFREQVDNWAILWSSICEFSINSGSMFSLLLYILSCISIWNANRANPTAKHVLGVGWFTTMPMQYVWKYMLSIVWDKPTCLSKGAV